jgi:hypothetical protein
LASARIVRARPSSSAVPCAVTKSASAFSAVSYRIALSFGTPTLYKSRTQGAQATYHDRALNARRDYCGEVSVRLALCQTLDLWCVQCIELAVIGLLLCKQPSDPCQRLGKVRCEPRTIQARVQWEGNRLRLHRRVDCHALKAGRLHRTSRTAASTVAASSRFIPLAPIRSRQRVRELGSVGSVCWR